MAQERPYTPAAAVFPGPARANPSVFYDARGNARGAAEVYRSLVGRYSVARGGPANKVAPQLANQNDNVAGTREQRLVGVVRPRAKPAIMPEPVAAAGQARLTPRQARARSRSGVPRPVPQHRLARAGRAAGQRALEQSRAGPARGRAGEAPAAARDACAAPRHGGPLDLFQEQLPDARALFRGRV